MFCSLYVSFSLLYFPVSSLLFCLKNVFLRVQAKKRLWTIPCSKVKASVAFSRCLGVITSSAVGIFGITNCTDCFRSSNAEKQRDPQQQKQEKNSVPEMKPKQLAYFSAEDSRQHNNNNNNKRSARNGNCSKAKANRRQAHCVLPRDIPHYHSTTFQRRRRYA